MLKYKVDGIASVLQCLGREDGLGIHLLRNKGGGHEGEQK